MNEPILTECDCCLHERYCRLLEGLRHDLYLCPECWAEHAETLRGETTEEVV